MKPVRSAHHAKGAEHAGSMRTLTINYFRMKSIARNNIGIVSVLTLVLSMTSCERFIDTVPESSVTIDGLYKTDKDFKDALVGCYSAFQAPYNLFWQFSDLRGDDVGNYAAYNPALSLVDDFAMDVNADVLNDAWEGYYNAIYRVNLLLSKLAEVDPSAVPNREVYTAEAKFLRALAYFDLVRIFGDVPLLANLVSIEESFLIGRTPVADIYEQLIIHDLSEIENVLPQSYTGAEVGRVTKGAAKALLGKVYLTRGDFENAEIKLQEVTTLGYALLDNFNDLFDYDNEHHSEYIFDIEYVDGNIGLGSVFTTTFMLEVQAAGIDLVSELQRIYEIEVINSRSSGSPEQGLVEAFEAGDLRKDITAATGVTNEEGVFVPIRPGGIPAFTKKYMTSLVIENDSRTNWKVIRYADVLLMYAEALNENGKTEEALTYLNQVRTRAGVDGYDDLSQGETREKIYLERRLELYMEGHRWFDLVRTGKALDALEAKGMEPHMTVFPIPQSQIEVVNDPSIFPQNTGY